jgi:hypothetical protein
VCSGIIPALVSQAPAPGLVINETEEAAEYDEEAAAEPDQEEEEAENDEDEDKGDRRL